MPAPLFGETTNDSNQFKPVDMEQMPAFPGATISNVVSIQSVAQQQLQQKMNQLSPTDRQQVETFKNSFIINDMNGLSKYGSQASDIVNKLADGVLATTKSNALDDVGNKVNMIMCQAKGLDVGQLGRAEHPTFIQRMLPWMKVTKEKFMQQFDTVKGQIEKYVDEINQASKGIDTSINLLENMGTQSVIYYNQLELLIYAGKQKSIELYEDVDKKKAYFAALPAESVNPIEMSEFQQLQNYADTLDKRVSDLERIQQVIYMQMPQIQIMVKNSVDMRNQFGMIVSSTIPLWKQQFVQSLVINQQKRGAEVIKAANDFTNDLLKQNADNLRVASIAIATEGQRGVVDIDTLKHVQNQTIATIDGVLELYKKGKEDRANISDEIGKMRNEFRTSLQGKM